MQVRVRNGRVKYQKRINGGSVNLLKMHQQKMDDIEDRSDDTNLERLRNSLKKMTVSTHGKKKKYIEI